MLPFVVLGSIGFDCGNRLDVTVSAVPVRREQLAKSKSKRQRRSFPSRGLKGVHAQGDRVARGRKHTISAAPLLRVAVQIQKVVEAPIMTPGRRRPLIASNSTTHVSERPSEQLQHPGSIPGESTGNMRPVSGRDTLTSRYSGDVLGGLHERVASPSKIAASSDGQGLRGTLRHADVVKPVLNPTESGSPSRSANSATWRAV